MTNKGKLHLCACLLVLVALLSGCMISLQPYEEPYMTDCTDRADAVLTEGKPIQFRNCTIPDCTMLMYMLGYTGELPQYGPIDSRADVRMYADRALRDILGEQYINRGTKLFLDIRTVLPEEDVWLYSGGKTYVALRKSDGQVLTCTDLRIHKNVKKLMWKTERLVLHFDILSLDRKALLLCGAENSPIGWRPTGEPVTEPAQAYAITQDMIQNASIGPLALACGEFQIYYSKKADVWIVHNDGFSLAIAPEDGTYLGLWDSNYRPN